MTIWSQDVEFKKLNWCVFRINCCHISNLRENTNFNFTGHSFIQLLAEPRRVVELAAICASWSTTLPIPEGVFIVQPIINWTTNGSARFTKVVILHKFWNTNIIVVNTDAWATLCTNGFWSVLTPSPSKGPYVFPRSGISVCDGNTIYIV